MTGNVGKIIRQPRMRKVRKKYTAKEFFEFTKDKNERYELIDGKIYLMASPSVEHQEIIGYIYRKFGNYLENKDCRVFIAPLDVVLFEKSDKDKKDNAQNVFQPDVFVVCDSEKISKNKINGAPDFIIEVVSPSSLAKDYYDKLNAYRKYGVKEYWIINPNTKEIFVYINKKSKDDIRAYSFNDKIKVSIFDDFEIDFKQLKL